MIHSLSLSLSLSLPHSLLLPGPASVRADFADFELPAYDDVVVDDGPDEPVLDENERIALQEEEDARIAQELFKKEQETSMAERESMHVHVCVCVCVCSSVFIWCIIVD